MAELLRQQTDAIIRLLARVETVLPVIERFGPFVEVAPKTGHVTSSKAASAQWPSRGIIEIFRLGARQPRHADLYVFSSADVGKKHELPGLGSDSSHWEHVSRRGVIIRADADLSDVMQHMVPAWRR